MIDDDIVVVTDEIFIGKGLFLHLSLERQPPQEAEAEAAGDGHTVLLAEFSADLQADVESLMQMKQEQDQDHDRILFDDHQERAADPKKDAREIR